MSLSEGQYPGEFIIHEPSPDISRETVTVTVAAATKLQPGHVLAKLSATGKYVEYDNAGTDGSEEAAAILYSECDNTSGETSVDFTAAIVARLAAVRKGDLKWFTGAVTGDKTAAYTDLAAVNIIARD